MDEGGALGGGSGAVAGHALVGDIGDQAAVGISNMVVHDLK